MKKVYKLYKFGDFGAVKDQRPPRYFKNLKMAKRSIPGATAPCRRVVHNELVCGTEDGRWKHPEDVFKGWGIGGIYYIERVKVSDEEYDRASNKVISDL